MHINKEKKMLKYIESFFEEFDYPIDSKKTLISAYKTIEESNFANRIL